MARKKSSKNKNHKVSQKATVIMIGGKTATGYYHKTTKRG